MALASSLFGCARANQHGDGGMGSVDGRVARADSNTPNMDTPCGPAGQACCAGNTCELGLRCNRGQCCLQANSSTRCTSASECCTGLTCTAGACCAGRSSTCAGSSDCCTGLVCSGGVCLSPDMGDIPGMMGCGGAGGTCCTGFTCRSGLVCNSTNGHCEGCGVSGMRCCDGATPCTSTGLVCNPASGNCENAPDPAMRCGRIDGPCCGPDGTMPDTTGHGNCEGGLVCTAGRCSDATDTGGMGQPCNPRGGCDTGNICDHSTNTCMTTPMDCGHNMMMCCDTGATAQSCDGNQNCQFGMCSSCQGPSLTCLLGGIIPGQGCCNGAVCRPAPLVPRCCVGAGQMCTNSLDCCGFMQCGTDHTCTAGRTGSFCVDSSECGMGLTCQTFTCQPDPMISCMPQGQMCASNAECCTGGQCGVRHNSPVEAQVHICCAGRDGACTSADDCCGNMQCADGMCLCRSPDALCFRDAECCETGTEIGGLTGRLGCVGGACHVIDNCRRPGGTGSTDCTQRSDCCFPLGCRIGHGTTQTQCCLDGGGPCDHDTDCCGTMTCTMGRCQCQTLGAHCSNDVDCCGLAFCSGGLCVDH